VAEGRPGKRVTQFERAADGSMTLIEHIRELRSRLLKATIAVVIGAAVSYYFASRVQDFILVPYCDYMREQMPSQTTCLVNAASVLDPLVNQLKIALYLGLVISSPVWLYQLWAFIAPGLHRRERRYTYGFVGAAVPLFALGVWAGYELFTRSLKFLLGVTSGITVQLEIGGYFDFMTSVMLFFGLGFELRRRWRRFRRRWRERLVVISRAR